MQRREVTKEKKGVWKPLVLPQNSKHTKKSLVRQQKPSIPSWKKNKKLWAQLQAFPVLADMQPTRPGPGTLPRALKMQVEYHPMVVFHPHARLKSPTEPDGRLLCHWEGGHVIYWGAKGAAPLQAGWSIHSSFCSTLCFQGLLHHLSAALNLWGRKEKTVIVFQEWYYWHLSKRKSRFPVAPFHS